MDPDLLSNSSHRFTTRFDNNYNGRYKRKEDLVVELLSGDVTSPCDDRLKGAGIHGQSLSDNFHWFTDRPCNPGREQNLFLALN